MTTETKNTEKVNRNVFLRILYSIIWFIPCFIIFSAIVGGIVGAIIGAMAGSEVTTFSEGYAAGGQVVSKFMSKYGHYVNLSAIVIWLILSVLGILPGTSKYKRVKS